MMKREKLKPASKRRLLAFTLAASLATSTISAPTALAQEGKPTTGSSDSLASGLGASLLALLVVAAAPDIFLQFAAQLFNSASGKTTNNFQLSG